MPIKAETIWSKMAVCVAAVLFLYKKYMPNNKKYGFIFNFIG